MAKSVAEKLLNSKLYKELNGTKPLEGWQICELDKFISEIGFSYDRLRTLAVWVNLGLDNWSGRFTECQSLPNSALRYCQLYYGESLGQQKYEQANLAKTKHFDHSSETQKLRALKAGEKLRGTSEFSCRSKAFWIKKGLSESEAELKVREIQATNTKDRYIKKYGEEGLAKFNARKQAWGDLMSDGGIGKSRSLGLWRYVERYGEVEGRRRYVEMRNQRNKRSKIGKASDESIRVLQPIIELLEQRGITFYVGQKNNHEWFIYDYENERPYFYDLTIPSLSIIVEYHGEAFHPNPNWDKSQWDIWSSPFSKVTADEQFAVDQHKRILAESKGWAVYEVYSSDTAQVDSIYNKLLALANSSSSSGS